MEFYKSLAEKRSSGNVSREAKQSAREYCCSGFKVSNVQDVWSWMLRKYPSDPVFDASLVEGRFPEGIAAFITSVDREWSSFQQHSVYVLLGEICLMRLREGKESLMKEKYRDWMAGAHQHKANGLLHAAIAAQEAGDVAELVVASGLCYESLLAMVQEAVKHQQQSVALRSEKYASKDAGASVFPAYKSALENLAKCFGALARMTADEKERAHAGRLETQYMQRALGLAMADPIILRHAQEGTLSHEQQAHVKRDIAARNISISQVTGQAAAQKSFPTCLLCKGKPQLATHLGVSCRCRCLCASCVELDTLMDCPACGEFTEFRS